MSNILDKRTLVNGKNSRIKLSSGLNLDTLITSISTNIINDTFSELTDDVNTLRDTIIVNENYNVTVSNYRIAVNNTAVITLPTATGITGKTFFVIATSANSVTITVNGIQTINGLLSIVLLNQYEYVEVTAIDGQYYIVNSNYTPS